MEDLFANCDGNCDICDSPCGNNDEIIMTGKFKLNQEGKFIFVDDKGNIYPAEINSSCKITQKEAIEMKQVRIKGSFIKKEGSNKKIFDINSSVSVDYLK